MSARSPLDIMIDRACGIETPRDPVSAFLAKHANDPDTIICTCGQERKIGQKCSTPKRCAILFARASCVCSLPGATRRECANKRGNKTPCRCYCHTRLPEEKRGARSGAAQKAKADQISVTTATSTPPSATGAR